MLRDGTVDDSILISTYLATEVKMSLHVGIHNHAWLSMDQSSVIVHWTVRTGSILLLWSVKYPIASKALKYSTGSTFKTVFSTGSVSLRFYRNRRFDFANRILYTFAWCKRSVLRKIAIQNEGLTHVTSWLQLSGVYFEYISHRQWSLGRHPILFALL